MDEIREVVLAVSANIEGDTTALYLGRVLQELLGLLLGKGQLVGSEVVIGLLAVGTRHLIKVKVVQQ